MSKKPKPVERIQRWGSGTIKISPELAFKLRIVGEFDHKTVAELLDPVIRQYIETNYLRVIQHGSSLARREG